MDLAIRALNLGLGAARLGVRITFGVVRTAAHIVGLDGAESATAPPDPPLRADRQVEVDVEVVVAEPEPAAEPTPEPAIDVEAAPIEAPPAPRRTVPEPEPAHIDDEPELVGEFAEPGAEEGAHAELHVDEPWPGYRRMKVADVRERLAVADVAQLAIVQLYESTNRKRKSILDAVERRNRELANSPSAR